MGVSPTNGIEATSPTKNLHGCIWKWGTPVYHHNGKMGKWGWTTRSRGLPVNFSHMLSKQPVEPPGKHDPEPSTGVPSELSVDMEISPINPIRSPSYVARNLLSYFKLFWALPAEDSNILFHQRLVQDLLAFGVSKVSLKKLPVPTKPDIRYIRLRQMCLEAILLVATNSGQWPLWHKGRIAGNWQKNKKLGWFV